MSSAARALLQAKGIHSKTHAGVLTELGRAYVRPGLLGAALAGSLREIRDLRERTDYGVHIRISEEQADAVVADAERFVEAAAELLSRPT